MLHSVLAATLLLVAPILLHGQEPVRASSDRPGAALPAAEAERVQSILADARERALDAPVESYLRELVAKHVSAALVAEGLQRRFDELSAAQRGLSTARIEAPATDEIVAGAEVVRRGATGADISALASSAPSGRSLAVPLLVMAELMDRGLPSDDAVARVRERLASRATDVELHGEPSRAPRETQPGRGNAPATAADAAGRNGVGRAPSRGPRGRSRKP